MKIAALLIMFLSFTVTAQVPEKNMSLLVGHQIHVRPLNESELKWDGGYGNFYSDADLRYIYKVNAKYKTPPEALADRKFNVVSAEPYRSTGDNYYKLKLEGGGETLYYSYKEGAPVQFKALGITLPDDYYCAYIKETYDEANKQTIFTVEQKYIFRILKFRLPQTTFYSIYLETAVDKIGTGKGATLILENGQKIVKPEADIKMNTKTATAHYSTSVVLTDEEVRLLEKHKIASFRLHVYDQVMFNESADIIKGAMGCLAKK